MCGGRHCWAVVQDSSCAMSEHASHRELNGRRRKKKKDKVCSLVDSYLLEVRSLSVLP